MSKLTLVIPDVHEQVDRLEQIEREHFSRADRIVMLGDFFDTFRDRQAKRTAQWIKDHDNVEKLLGNHDCSYFFEHDAMRCSGFHGQTLLDIQAVLTREDMQKFKLSTNVGSFLLSHAGYHPVILKEIAGDPVDFVALRTIEEEALRKAHAGEFHWLFAAGRARGGGAPVGGPVWLDWYYEWHIPAKIGQVVGHTPDYNRKNPQVRTKTHPDTAATSYALDTHLNHVMLINEETDEVEVVALDGKGKS